MASTTRAPVSGTMGSAFSAESAGPPAEELCLAPPAPELRLPPPEGAWPLPSRTINRSWDTIVPIVRSPDVLFIDKDSAAVAAAIAYFRAPCVDKKGATTELTVEVLLDLNNSQSTANNHRKAPPRGTSIAKSPPAACASVSPAVGGGGGSSHTHTSPPITICPSSSSAGSPSRTDPVAGNCSGTPPSPPSEGGSAGTGTVEGSTSTTTTTSGPPAGSTPPTGGPSATGANEGLHLTFVLTLLGYIVAVMIGILPDSKNTIGGWSTAAQVVYVIVVVLAIMFMSAGFMAAGRHVTLMMAGNHSQLGLPISAFCAKLGAILSSALFVVVMACRYAGRWGCVAGVSSAVLVAGIMAAFWILGDETAVVQAVSGCWGRVDGLHHQQRQLAGDEMV